MILSLFIFVVPLKRLTRFPAGISTFESPVSRVVAMSTSYSFSLINWGYIPSLKVIRHRTNRYFSVICFSDMRRYKMTIRVNSLS